MFLSLFDIRRRTVERILRANGTDVADANVGGRHKGFAYRVVWPSWSFVLVLLLACRDVHSRGWQVDGNDGK